MSATDKANMADNTSTAMVRVLNITELRELIIDKLPANNIALAQGVNSNFKGTIQKSPVLKKKITELQDLCEAARRVVENLKKAHDELKSAFAQYGVEIRDGSGQ